MNKTITALISGIALLSGVLIGFLLASFIRIDQSGSKVITKNYGMNFNISDSPDSLSIHNSEMNKRNKKHRKKHGKKQIRKNMYDLKSKDTSKQGRSLPGYIKRIKGEKK